MYHIGQEVVCIKQDDEKKLKIDSIYIVKGVSACTCKTALNVGLNLERDYVTYCTKCLYEWKNDGIDWCESDLFVPLERFIKKEVKELFETAKKPFEV